MTTQCGKCAKPISNARFLKCSGCTTDYHLPCTSVSEARFNTFYATNKEKKGSWKCKTCLRKGQAKPRTSSPKPSSSTSIDYMTPTKNITVRKKPVVNVTTENSFQYLSTEEDETDLDSINMGNRSCPDAGTNHREELEEMRKTIQYLQEKLEAADNEIANLLLENGTLKKKMESCEQKVDNLTRICKSTPKSTHNFKSSQENRKTQRSSKSSRKEPRKLEYAEERNSTSEKSLREIEISEKPNIRDNSHLETQNNKTKLCLISNQKYIGTLAAIEGTFDSNVDYCHYSTPNCELNAVLKTLNNKLINFTMSDYCVLLLGEIDFKGKHDNTELVRNIRNVVQKITHTNVIICLPTYICGAPIYNYVVEMFGKLLINDIQIDNYCYVFDTNQDLSFDMFSYYSGGLNKYGIRNVFLNIQKFITEIKTFFRE